MSKKKQRTVGFAFTGSFCTYEKIKEVIWHNKDTANANINKTVIRLRKNLKSASIPLSIESVRALGYQIREKNDKPLK